MSIQAFLPILSDNTLYQMFRSILQKAVDGTRVPLFVDESANQRVIVGGTVSVGNGSVFQVQSGDAEVTTAGKGFVGKDIGGTGKFCRMVPRYDAASGNWTLEMSTVP